MDTAAMKVLVVDDSSTMRRVVVNSLARCGFTKVGEAGNGVEALEKCGQEQYHIILTDWNMPEMDGMSFVIQVRKMPNYATVPIMMVTTEGGKQDVLEALMKGVDNYVVKPFTPDVLQKKMEELIAKMKG